jgi:hypothetical protein
MAYVHPKCAHGRNAIQLFYHNSFVCPDVCATPPVDIGGLKWYALSEREYVHLTMLGKYTLPDYAVKHPFETAEAAKKYVRNAGHRKGYTWILIQYDPKKAEVWSYQAITE